MPKNSRSFAARRPNLNGPALPGLTDAGAGRLEQSSASNPSMTSRIAAPSCTEWQKIETQSSVGQFGTRPRDDTSPTVGLIPTMSLNPAGMRPEPPVSVPSANPPWPAAAATAQPELEPPET